MALQVWLPLNGDLTNQGLSNVTVTNNGATVDNNGKIGKCYSFDGVDDYIQIPPMTLDLSCASICGWIKWRAFNSWSRMFDFQNSASGSTGAIGIANNGTSSTITVFGRTSSGVGLPDTDIGLSAVANTWYHIALILDNTTAKVYLNGTLTKTFTLNSALGVMTLNNNYLGKSGWPADKFFQGSMNDFRIYDHCLSAKEVKELAKGLVLHYRLAGPGQENLILESHKVTGSGVGSGITRSFEPDGSLKIISTPGNNNYCSIGFGKDSNPNVGSKIAVGDKYTISLDIKVESGTKLPTLFINGGNSYKQLLGTIVPGKWIRAYYTSTWNTPGTNYGNISLHLGFSSAIGTYYVKNFKLEKSNIPTPWCPAPGDSLYSTLGYDNNIEYDCSGYNRNGTKSGTITWDADSPKYTTSYKWPAATSAASRIISPNCNFDGKGITMAVWVKFTGATGGGGNYHMPLESSSPGYYEMSIDTSGRLRAGIYVNGTRYVENCSNPSMYDGKWHHIAITYDGAKICRYVDAKAYVQTNVTGTANGLEQAFYLGSYGTNTSYYNNNIWESDARVYTTALSAEDIAELYHSAVIVDNTGKNYAYEYFET